MSIFNELLPKIKEISKDYIKDFNDELKVAFQFFDKFEEEFQNGRIRAREKPPKDKNLMTTLQSINEDEDESRKTPTESSEEAAKSTDDARSSLDSNGERRGSKKRNKNEVDGMSSPEQDKRQKRNASVKAQSIISKQVNVNLNQKLRREEPSDKSRSRRRKDDDKENTEPVPLIQVKQEKISLPPEQMEQVMELPVNIEMKREVNEDEVAMPPPAAPVLKPRKQVQKDKSEESSEEDGNSSRRRTTRTRKQTDTMPAPPAGGRSTRASRATRTAEPAAPEQPVEETARPKRTRAKKKADTDSSNTEKESQAPQENGIGSPAEKPRPKRTRRGQKAAEKEEPQKPIEQPKPAESELLSPKEERISQPEMNLPPSPIIQPKVTKKQKPKHDDIDGTQSKINLINDTTKVISIQESFASPVKNMALEETRVIPKDSNVVNGDMDKTVVLPNGVYNHAPVTPKNVRNMNETVVLETCSRETMVLEKPKAIMDATVVIEKDPKAGERLTDDNSLITDDSDTQDCTPPRPPPPNQPTSAVKEKVQQFEEMASRVTRTKTRAMAKKDEQTETQTPPDKPTKPVLSAETLTKMNSMIFNGKPPQTSSSTSKLRANTTAQPKSLIPSSTSKLSGINKAREAAEEQKREKEDARKKKEAMLEAKRELQKKKREDKMAAAAAVRQMADRERKAAMEAALKERLEKQAHADLGKLERLKEVERKKQELARKAAETEERRRAEEQARRQRLAEEQRRADAARRKQLEEAEATKKEAAIMAREIEKRQKEYIEKQKMKQRMEGDKIFTPLKTPGTPSGQPLPPMEPVYMADGFQYLNSDEDEEPVDRPVPAWSTSKARRKQLMVQARVSTAHIDKLFSVREHSPDLRELFPAIERARLKRTSSAVWRTPPARLPALRE
ncbi:uncharacterized protein Incenp isoform X2 [Epargyreus clarus]|uniref:uncharacterized protein Incenp isoform X2 n=1 Tax=Epargyreus clarus TaxID=520877 RepID=UPI003C30623D